MMANVVVLVNISMSGGSARSRAGPRRCRRRRLVRSRYLPGISGHVPWRPYLRDRPRLAARQVRGHHRVQVIRRTGTTPDGMGSRRRVDESAAEPRFARR
jgi:hypothetical protein